MSNELQVSGFRITQVDMGSSWVVERDANCVANRLSRFRFPPLLSLPQYSARGAGMLRGLLANYHARYFLYTDKLIPFSRCANDKCYSKKLQDEFVSPTGFKIQGAVELPLRSLSLSEPAGLFHPERIKQGFVSFKRDNHAMGSRPKKGYACSLLR